MRHIQTGATIQKKYGILCCISSVKYAFCKVNSALFTVTAVVTHEIPICVTAQRDLEVRTNQKRMQIAVIKEMGKTNFAKFASAN